MYIYIHICTHYWVVIMIKYIYIYCNDRFSKDVILNWSVVALGVFTNTTRVKPHKKHGVWPLCPGEVG